MLNSDIDKYEHVVRKDGRRIVFADLDSSPEFVGHRLTSARQDLSSPLHERVFNQRQQLQKSAPRANESVEQIRINILTPGKEWCLSESVKVESIGLSLNLC